MDVVQYMNTHEAREKQRRRRLEEPQHVSEDGALDYEYNSSQLSSGYCTDCYCSHNPPCPPCECAFHNPF